MHSKVEPASGEVKPKVGVGSLIAAPWLGPEMIAATGGVVSALKPLNTDRAGFGSKLCFSKPAVAQKVQPVAWDSSGSRQ